MISAVLVAIALSLLALSIMLFAVIASQSRDLKKMQEELEKERRKSATSLSQSRSVIKGQLAEQMFPLSINCPYNMADMKFFGQPFDYIVLNGLATGDVTEVCFVEIKTGSSRLSSIQRSIKRCIDDKRVSWATVTIDKEREDDRAIRETTEEVGVKNTDAAWD
jgi:predicted Holliday junction resolvase-like endonuclease